MSVEAGRKRDTSRTDFSCLSLWLEKFWLVWGRKERHEHYSNNQLKEDLRDKAREQYTYIHADTN